MHAITATVALGLYFSAIVTFIAGNTVALTLEENASTVTADVIKTVGACLLLISSTMQWVSDSLARSSQDRDANSTRLATDYPSAILNVLVGCLIVASSACFLSHANGGPGREAGALVLLVLSVVAVISTQLMFIAEVERTIDVAVVTRAVCMSLASGTLESVLLRALEDHDQSTRQRAEVGSYPVSMRSLCCRPRPCISVRALRNAMGWWVLPATILDLLAAVYLLAASVLIITNTSRVASLILLEVCFSLFLAAVTLIVIGGSSLIAAHRRGGKAHLELDVRRALRREGVLSGLSA